MAKKSRRSRSKQTSRPAHVAASPSTISKVQPGVPSKPATREPSSPAANNGVDFRSEYHYVVTDLRQMAIIAVGMLIVLFGLSFLIQ
jgi:hypothetical protein